MENRIIGRYEVKVDARIGVASRPNQRETMTTRTKACDSQRDVTMYCISLIDADSSRNPQHFRNANAMIFSATTITKTTTFAPRIALIDPRINFLFSSLSSRFLFQHRRKLNFLSILDIIIYIRQNETDS